MKEETVLDRLWFVMLWIPTKIIQLLKLAVGMCLLLVCMITIDVAIWIKTGEVNRYSLEIAGYLDNIWSKL